MIKRMSAGLVLVALLVGGAGAETEAGSWWYAVDHITEVDEDGRIVLWATLPAVWHGQEVAVGAIEPEPVAVLEDSVTGNRVVEWVVEPDRQPPPLNVFFHYDFEFEQAPVRFDIDPAAVGTYDRSDPLYRQYTAPETWIQVDGPVLDRARRIVGDQDNPWLQAGLIYDWMLANLKYRVPGPDGQDAESVLAAREGDCSQFSVLMTAMLRSLGVPARTVTNAWTTGGDHVFLEFWLEGYGWVPADPSLGQMMTPDGGFTRDEVALFMEGRNVPVDDPRYLLGNLFDGRLIMTVGNNVTFESPTLGHRVTLHAMKPGGRKAHPDGFRIDGLNRDIVHGGFWVFGEALVDEEAAHAMTHQRLADSFFNVGMYEVVEDVCRKSIEKYSDGVQPWINMGKVYMHKGEYYKAEAAFKRAQQGLATKRKEKLESAIWTHNYLGNCYDLLGRHDMAVIEYQKVIDTGNNYRGAVDYARRHIAKPFTLEKAPE